MGMMGGHHGTSTTVPRPVSPSDIFFALIRNVCPFQFQGLFKLQLGTHDYLSRVRTRMALARPPHREMNENTRVRFLPYQSLSLMLFEPGLTGSGYP
jgi:hypothetical protein